MRKIFTAFTVVSALLALSLSMSAEGVRPQRPPISIGVLVESSEQMAPLMEAAHGGFHNLLTTLQPADEVFIFAFSQNVSQVLDFTEDKNAVAEAFGRFLNRGRASLNIALQEAVKKVREGKHERKVLLVITAARLDDSDMGRSRAVLQKVKDVVVHAIGMSIDCGPCERAVKDFAKVTGGTFAGITPMPGRRYSIDPAFQTIAEVLSKP